MRAFLLAFLLLISLQLPADAAARFWVGGTGDCSDTAHWAATSGGAGGQTVPGSADAPTFDGSSGGGVVTCTGPFTWQAITTGAFTGTINFSGNFTLTGSATSAFLGSGAGTRTINAGNGTWTINTVAAAPISIGTITNLTFDAQGSTWVIQGNTTQSRLLTFDGLTWNNITIEANASKGTIQIDGPVTIAGTLDIAAGAYVLFEAGTTTTIGTLVVNGSAANPTAMVSTSVETNAVISSANNSTIPSTSFRSITFQGGGTFSTSNSFDQGQNVGIVIAPPALSGGGIFGG